MTIERTKTVTITARDDASAVAHVEKALAAPDKRWVMGKPVVTRRMGSQRTVRVTFRLSL